jgi:hypothetical protein
LKENNQLPANVQQLLHELLQILKDTPLSPRAQALRDGDAITCPSSGRVYDAQEVERLNNGYFEILNTIHPDLRKDLKGLAKVACVQCREVVAFLSPGKDKDGFVIEPEKIYHIHYCPRCEPDKFRVEGQAVVTELIEKTIFLKHK